MRVICVICHFHAYDVFFALSRLSRCFARVICHARFFAALCLHILCVIIIIIQLRHIIFHYEPPKILLLYILWCYTCACRFREEERRHTLPSKRRGALIYISLSISILLFSDAVRHYYDELPRALSYATSDEPTQALLLMIYICAIIFLFVIIRRH